MASPARRIRALSRILSGERKVSAATKRALLALLEEAARALNAAGMNTDVLDSRNPTWRKALEAEAVPAILDVFTESFEAAGRGVVDPEPYATRHLESVWNRLVGVADEVFDQMRTTLNEGRLAGEGIRELAGRVDVLLSDEARWAGRAAMIARTEVISANNAGAHHSARATAEVLGSDPSLVVKEWLSTADDRTRESHIEADGQQVLGMDTPFQVGGSALDFPGDPSGPAEEVIQCRCTPLYHYPGDPDYPTTLSSGDRQGRAKAAQIPASPAASTPASVSPAASTPAAPAAQIQEPVVDPGPTSDQERMARALTIQELQMETRRGSAGARRAAKNELKRRGIAASAVARGERLLLTYTQAGSRYLTEAEVRAGTVDPADLIVTDGIFTQSLNQWLAAAEEDPVVEVPECTCCGGSGEHLCGHECYVCDAAGTREAQREAGAGLAPGDPIVCEGHHGRPDPCTEDPVGDGCQHEPDPVSPDAPPENTPTLEAAVTETAPETPAEPLAEPTHAGMAVQAADTGRVLLIQRSLDPTDAPEVRGTWEFPGGTIEEGEDALTAAWREFSEETGLPQPPGEVTGGWRSADGIYQGHVFTTPSEADAFPELNPDADAAHMDNPDDPGRRTPDVSAWFTLEQIQDLGPALRPEVYNTDWSQFAPTPQEADMPTDETAEAALVAAAARSDLETALAVVRQHGFAVQITAAEGDAPLVSPPAADEPQATAAEVPSDGEPFYGIIWPENVLSGDGRAVESGATTWRDLPLPIMAQDAQAPGHDGAVRVGRLDTIERDTTTYSVPVIRYAGVWDTNPSAVETARQVDKRMVRGISVDGDAVTVELRGSNGDVLDPMTDDFPEDGVVTEVATAARVSGGTVCSIPAFHQAYIANGTYEGRTEPEPGWNEDGTPKDNTVDGGAPAPVEDETLPLVASAAGGARRAPVWSITAGASVLPVVEGRYFSNPGLTEPTPLTVDDDGRVYGHLATWGTCHIGIDGYCQEPPVSASNYAFFAKGVVLTDEGERIRVGPLTMGTGHAKMEYGLRAAAEHYDNTGTRVADITMGQDGVGIWFSGRIRPSATPEQVFALAAAGAVSGDWREAVRYSGDLELVAALVVNVPGFAIPRPAVAASAASGLSMVAAGMVAPREEAKTRGEVHDLQAIAAAVVATLDRRDRGKHAASRLTAARAAARRRRVAAAAARITERG